MKRSKAILRRGLDFGQVVVGADDSIYAAAKGGSHNLISSNLAIKGTVVGMKCQFSRGRNSTSLHTRCTLNSTRVVGRRRVILDFLDRVVAHKVDEKNDTLCQGIITSKMK